MKTLYLIDGHAQFFRAFHAIRTPMTSPVTKEPTNATFGFVAMLLKLLRAKRPDYIAVAIDAAGDRGTFRSEIDPQYKANRDAPPETLPPQIERCVSLLGAMGAPVLAAERVEADDTIATIATAIIEQEPDVLVRIVSKDKDLQQLLLEGRVEMYDVHTDEVLTEERLRSEKGIAPDQVVDMLTLMGDSVDNVPGVEGIGPKTAAELISRYGDLDSLLQRLDEIKGKRGERLRAATDQIPISKQLVTLRRDVPIKLTLNEAKVDGLNLEALAPILRELGFGRHQQDLKALLSQRGGGAEPAAEMPEPEESLFSSCIEITRPAGDYQCVKTAKDLRALVARLERADMIAVDTETTGVSPLRCELCGVSVSIEPGHGAYIPIRSPEPDSHLSQAEALDALRPILEDPAKPKCGHNLKFDMLVLRNSGVDMQGVSGDVRAPGGAVGFDSMIASYLIDSSRSSHSLDAVALALLGHTCQPISSLIGTGKKQRTFDTVPLEDAAPYAAEDADIALRLQRHMTPMLTDMGLMSLFHDVEMPLVDALAVMQWSGVAVDASELDRQAERINDRLIELREQIEDAAPRPFNPDSPKQLAAILFNQPGAGDEPGLGVKPIKKTKTGYSTDVEVLEKLASNPEITTPMPRLIIEHRQLTKLVSTYLVALKDAINPKTGRVHASFNQTVAATGRLSSSDPNLQNIPIRTDIGREIRRAFVAPQGRLLVAADYSQIELRMLAHLSGDAALKEAFEQGEDIHRTVAAQVFGEAVGDVTSKQRSAAKMVNFGIIYGVTPFGLARRLGVSSAEAATIIDEYKKRFPGITTFLDQCVEQARRLGYVETILKRRRPITEIEARNPQRRALAARMAINSVVQGSAADLIKLAMIDLHRRLHSEPGLQGVKMILQIHDELLLEAPVEDAEKVRRLVVERMEQAMRLDTPLKADSSVARSWFEGA